MIGEENQLHQDENQTEKKPCNHKHIKTEYKINTRIRKKYKEAGRGYDEIGMAGDRTASNEYNGRDMLDRGVRGTDMLGRIDGIRRDRRDRHASRDR